MVVAVATQSMMTEAPTGVSVSRLVLAWRGFPFAVVIIPPVWDYNTILACLFARDLSPRARSDFLLVRPCWHPQASIDHVFG